MTTRMMGDGFMPAPRTLVLSTTADLDAFIDSLPLPDDDDIFPGYEDRESYEANRSTYSGAPDECSIHWPTKASECTECFFR